MKNPRSRIPQRLTAQLVLCSWLLSASASVAPAAMAAEKIPLPRPRPAEAPKWGVAQPIVDQVEGAKTREAIIAGSPENAPQGLIEDDRDPKYQIALCDPDTGDQFAKPGYGAPVMSWSLDSDKWQKSARDFIASRRKDFLDNDVYTKIHRKYSSVQNPGSDQPDLRPGWYAIEVFFWNAFGKEEGGKVTYGAIIKACRAKRVATAKFKAYTELRKKSGSDESDACKGSNDEQRKNLAEAKKYVDEYVNGLQEIYDGKTANFKGRFYYLRKIDRRNYQIYSRAGANGHMNADDLNTLKLEYNMFWGKKAIDKPEESLKVQSGGLYSNILLQLQSELKKSKEQSAELKKEIDKFNELAKSCGGGILGDAMAHGGSTSDITGTNNNVNGNGSTNNNSTGNGNENVDNSGGGTGNVDNSGNGNVDNSGAGARAQPDPTQDGKGDPNGGGKFLHDNWKPLMGGLLIGGVVIGGGFLAYKAYQHHKDKEWMDEHPMPPITYTTGGSTTSSSSGGTALPAAGSKLILTSSISGATVGQTVSPIHVSLVDANGTVQNMVAGTVNVSCLTPNPCSLDGAKSISLGNGSVTFDGLKFNQPDRGVTLEFSMPGVQSVTTPGTFDVGGSAQRQ
jgi:hypothetical protein